MAITTTTISKSAGWARTDAILQLEEAFTWLGWHGETQTGIVTGISAYSGGGTIVGSSSTDHYDVFTATTTGIGTGASFYVDRSGGTVAAIYVNRPGVGYTNGEYVTLSPADIGGSANGAVAIGITVLVEGGASPVSYGSTTTFYDKDVTAGGSFPWGVLRHTIQSNKKFGDTYRGFQMLSNTNLAFHVGSGFHPTDISNPYVNRGKGYSNRFAGNLNFDMPTTPVLSDTRFDRTSNAWNYVIQTTSAGETIANSTSYQLDLNIYKSGIDPKFAVLSYKHPTLSSTKLRDNTYLTFIFHNYTSTLWDYDNVFLSGLTFIVPNTDDSNPYLEFRTYIAGDYYSYTSSTPSKRAAEFGYVNIGSNSNYITPYKSTFYRSTSCPQNASSYDSNIYVRNNATTSNRGNGGDNNTEYLPSATNFNAVIKGIPISTHLIPCPYYLPDDFVLIDFDFATPSTNIQQGDTITISGSEVYTVITGSYNQTTRTRGILFCARTV
jgi:hypothetical protein